jgi:hypothetical protein
VPEQPAPPAADQPKHEPKHEATPAAGAPRADEGKKDEGKQQGRGAQATLAPAEPAMPVGSSPRHAGNAKGKDAPTPVVDASLPVVATTAAAVEDAKSKDSRKDRGHGNDERQLTSVAPAQVVEAPEPAPDQAPAVDAAAPVVAETAPVAESGDNGKRKGK